MFNLQDMSGQYQRGNADADLKLKQAEEMKVMQEVYDLAVNNQYQKMVMQEETSPQGQRVRSHKREAGIAKSESEMWQSWNTTRSEQHEQVEAGMAVFNQNPSQETYDIVRQGIVKANPSIASVLDEKYSPQSAQQLKAVQRSWLNNRSFKQNVEKMGIAAELQEEFAQAQVGRDKELQMQKAKDALSLMEAQMTRRDWQIGLENEYANERATAALDSGLQLAKRWYDDGHPDLAMAQLRLMEQQRMMIKMAKAKGGGLTGEKDAQQIAIKAYDQTKAALEDDWSNVEDLGVDADFKIHEARGMSNTINSLHEKGAKFTSSDRLPAWTQERMIVWPGRNSWYELPLDNNGQPLGGWTSSEIRGLVGQETDPDANVFKGEISDLDEALEIYARIMQKDFGIDITKMSKQLGAPGGNARPATPY